jgi:hypothetical protein
MGGKSKRNEGFEGLKGGKKGGERDFCFWGFLAEIGLESREEGLTGLLVGVGKPQHFW